MSLNVITDSNDSINDLQNAISSTLGNLYLRSIDNISIDYGNSKNRIGVTYVPGSSDTEYAGDFEIIADGNSSMTKLVNSLLESISTEQDLTANLVPTSIAVAYTNSKHRATVAMGPSSIVGLPGNETYSIASFKEKNVDTLETDVNTWLANNTDITVIDTYYYYGDSKNRFWVLYYGTETDDTNDQTPSTSD